VGSLSRESVLCGNCCCKLQRSTARYCSRAFASRLRALHRACVDVVPWACISCRQPEAGRCVTTACPIMRRSLTDRGQPSQGNPLNEQCPVADPFAALSAGRDPPYEGGRKAWALWCHLPYRPRTAGWHFSCVV